MPSLTEYETKELLRQHDISVAQGKEVHSQQEAQTVAKQLGFPVMVKISSPDIQHKSDIGGIAEARTQQELSMYYEDVMRNAQEHTDNIEGMLIEKKSDGIPLAVGVNTDPQFGHVLMFGLGGIYIELIGDVHFRHIPLSTYDAKDLINDLRSKAILDGFRQFPPIKKRQLVSLLVKVSQFAETQPQMKSLDLNPVMAQGATVVVADAMLTT